MKTKIKPYLWYLSAMTVGCICVLFASGIKTALIVWILLAIPFPLFVVCIIMMGKAIDDLNDV